MVGKRLTDLAHRAWCHDCDWTYEGGDADKQAEKHTKVKRHATVSAAEPR